MNLEFAVFAPVLIARAGDKNCASKINRRLLKNALKVTSFEC